MHNDPTESMRRVLVADINREPGEREKLEAEHGQVWNTDEMSKDFSVLSFAAPFVVVCRKSDNKNGTLCFQHYPRFYFSFVEDK